MKAPYLVIFVAIAAVVGVEVSMSLAGRETALALLPFMSLQGAIVLIVSICLGMAYAAWSIARRHRWRLLARFGLVVVALAVSCVFLFVTSSERSTNEAREILSDFLKNPGKYKTSYSSGTNEQLLSSFSNPEAQIAPVFSSHPYGRYVYRIRSKGNGELVVQLNKDVGGPRLFVFEPGEYAGPHR